jgi:hypothetical protein
MLISPEQHKKVLNQSAFRKISLILRKCVFMNRDFFVSQNCTSSSLTQQMAMSGVGWKTLIKCYQPRIDMTTFFCDL